MCSRKSVITHAFTSAHTLHKRVKAHARVRTVGAGSGSLLRHHRPAPPADGGAGGGPASSSALYQPASERRVPPHHFHSGDGGGNGSSSGGGGGGLSPAIFCIVAVFALFVVVQLGGALGAGRSWGSPAALSRTVYTAGEEPGGGSGGAAPAAEAVGAVVADGAHAEAGAPSRLGVRLLNMSGLFVLNPAVPLAHKLSIYQSICLRIYLLSALCSS